MPNKVLKKTSLFLLWLLAATSACAQPQPWQRAPVGDSVTVEFPAAPTRQAMAAGTAYFNRSAEGTFIMVVKQKAFEADAAVDELEEFYNSVLAGMLEAGGGGKIVNQQAVDLNGFPAVRAQLALTNNAKITGSYFNQVVLVNGTCYAQSVLLAGKDTPALLADKDRFFASFSATKHRVAPGDPQRNTAAYRFGQLVGTVLIYGGLGALILFFGGAGVGQRKIRSNRFWGASS